MISIAKDGTLGKPKNLDRCTALRYTEDNWISFVLHLGIHG